MPGLKPIESRADIGWCRGATKADPKVLALIFPFTIHNALLVRAGEESLYPTLLVPTSLHGKATTSHFRFGVRGPRRVEE